MPDCRNRTLHHENVCPSFLRDHSKFGGALRNRTHRSDNTGVLDLAHTRGNEVLLDRFLVNPLQQRSDFRFIRLDDFLQNFLRVLIARLHSFKIQNGKSAKLIHCDGKAHIDHAVHGAGENGNCHLQRCRFFARQTKCDIHFVWVDGHAPGHERDLVEAIGHPRFAVSAYPHSHLKCSPF